MNDLQDVLPAYRRRFAGELRSLRETKGYSLARAAGLAGTDRKILESYESGAVHPKMSVFLRLAEVYQVDVLAVLVRIAREVLSGERPEGAWEADALLLFCGVVPDRVRNFDADLRIQQLAHLREEYESGASIKQMGKPRGIPYATMRMLLLEAGVVLRKGGGAGSWNARRRAAANSENSENSAT